MQYFFERLQRVVFAVSDSDSGGKSELIGETSTTLGEIVGIHRGVYTEVVKEAYREMRAEVMRMQVADRKVVDGLNLHDWCM